MDASKRSLHVYGKTPAGTNALGATRGAISSSARQLLILIDGKRSIGELSQIFPQETLNPSLDQLESQGLVECLRHFADSQIAASETEPEAAPAPNATVSARGDLPASSAVPTPVQAAAPARPEPRPRTRSTSQRAPGRRRTVAVTIGTCFIVAIGSYALFARRTAPIEVSSPPTNPPLPESTHPLSTADSPASIPRAGAIPGQEPSSARKSVGSSAAESQERAVSATWAAVNRASATGANAAPSPAETAATTKFSTLHIRSQVMPQLPQQAKALGIGSGHVAVVLHVNPQGTVDQVELVSATPPQVYDSAMEQAFHQWTFDPLGIPGRMTVEVEVAPPPGP